MCSPRTQFKAPPTFGAGAIGGRVADLSPILCFLTTACPFRGRNSPAASGHRRAVNYERPSEVQGQTPHTMTLVTCSPGVNAGASQATYVETHYVRA
jgi:hypothetical protein